MDSVREVGAGGADSEDASLAKADSNIKDELPPELKNAGKRRWQT